MIPILKAKSSYIPKNAYMAKALAVKEYSYQEEMNATYRNYMEDGYFIKDNILQDGGKSILFGIFDGHGGRTVVDFLIENFCAEFLSTYKLESKDIPKLFETTFNNLDLKIRSLPNSEQVGSTACVGFIRLEGAKRILYIANVGDTRAVLCQDSICERLSFDHKANCPEEIERVKRAGGNVFMGRVEGILAISRAFGDFQIKKNGLTCSPFVNKVELRLIHKFLIVASDGLWDVIKDEFLVDFLKGKENAKEISESLLNEAIAAGSGDNISLIVLKLN